MDGKNDTTNADVWWTNSNDNTLAYYKPTQSDWQRGYLIKKFTYIPYPFWWDVIAPEAPDMKRHFVILISKRIELRGAYSRKVQRPRTKRKQRLF